MENILYELKKKLTTKYIIYLYENIEYQYLIGRNIPSLQLECERKRNYLRNKLKEAINKICDINLKPEDKSAILITLDNLDSDSRNILVNSIVNDLKDNILDEIYFLYMIGNNLKYITPEIRETIVYYMSLVPEINNLNIGELLTIQCLKKLSQNMQILDKEEKNKINESINKMKNIIPKFYSDYLDVYLYSDDSAILTYSFTSK